MAYLVAKACQPDEGSLEQLHEIICGQVERGIDRAREATGDAAVCGRLQASAIGELDLLFGMARGILRNADRS
ncbi:MAG: hypothetical protein U1E60_31520 [Reyranellaceae bacterium]